MPKYASSMVTSKSGINFVRTVVESAGCIFHKIDQENDLGVDAIIELVEGETPLNKQIGIQIKSGQSYYDGPSNRCLVQVGSHFDYWMNYPLAVYGIVYVPSQKSANWVNIKDYLGHSGQCATIRFERTRTNIFDKDNFARVFIPTILNEVPKLSLDEAQTLFHSTHPSESYLGMIVLFRTAPNELKTWDWFIDLFRANEPSDIPPKLIYYLAHIPWHQDIFYTGEGFSESTKTHVQSRLDEFGKQDVVKLLSFIDEENGISRGSLGQSVESIISCLARREQFLLEIAEDRGLTLFQRECAALIYVFHNQKAGLPLLDSLEEQGSWLSGEWAHSLRQFGFLDPY